MAGCSPEGCNGPCSRRETPTRTTSLTDALARIIVDNRVIARTLELYELGVVRYEDLVAQINADKSEGRL